MATRAVKPFWEDAQAGGGIGAFIGHGIIGFAWGYCTPALIRAMWRTVRYNRVDMK
jgi:hypothetical protein